MIKYGGMIGALEMFEKILDPSSREECIVKAKIMIKAHRACIIAHAIHGRKYRGTSWLNRAAYYRKRAKNAK